MTVWQPTDLDIDLVCLEGGRGCPDCDYAGSLPGGQARTSTRFDIVGCPGGMQIDCDGWHRSPKCLSSAPHDRLRRLPHHHHDQRCPRILDVQNGDRVVYLVDYDDEVMARWDMTVFMCLVGQQMALENRILRSGYPRYIVDDSGRVIYDVTNHYPFNRTQSMFCADEVFRLETLTVTYTAHPTYRATNIRTIVEVLGTYGVVLSMSRNLHGPGEMHVAWLE
jgi:hypothetical protein